MKPIILLTLVSFFLFNCSNSKDIETGEVKTFNILRDALKESNSNTVNIDVKKIFTRKQIDKANIPILFIELSNGRNATLTKYPGEGVGVTWLSRDGATLTFNNGILFASRGMGDDIMGVSQTMPHWSRIKNEYNFTRKLSYLQLDNKVKVRQFSCIIKKEAVNQKIEIFGHFFKTALFKESCYNNSMVIDNFYYVDRSHTVRRSKQYHSDTLGYITVERLDK